MLRIPALVVVLALAGGCASSGYRRASATADKTTAYRDDLERLHDQVGLASEALRALCDNPGDSPRSNRETFETYAREVANLENAAKHSRKTYGRMDGRADRFFGGWNEDAALISDAELKQSAVDRRNALQANYAKLAQGQAEVDVALSRHVEALNDLRLYLEHDLTAAGIASARKPIERAFAEGDELQQQLSVLARTTDDASAALAPLRAQDEIAPGRTSQVR